MSPELAGEFRARATSDFTQASSLRIEPVEKSELTEPCRVNAGIMM
jgi:hypothetical protein